MFAYPEPVTVRVAGQQIDPYSDEPADTWEAGVAEHPESCAVAPGGSTEPTQDAREAVDSDFDLIFDHAPAITSRNRVIVRGLECEVDGRPVQWRSPFTGWEAGWVVRASIREG